MKRSAANWIELALIIIALMFALAVMAALIAAPAKAQQPMCGPRLEVLAALTGARYSEAPMIELENSQMTLHVYVNPATGTWTMIGLPGPQIACIVAAGKKMKMLRTETGGAPL